MGFNLGIQTQIVRLVCALHNFSVENKDGAARSVLKEEENVEIDHFEPRPDCMMHTRCCRSSAEHYQLR